MIADCFDRIIKLSLYIIVSKPLIIICYLETCLYGLSCVKFSFWLAEPKVRVQFLVIQELCLRLS